ncbi:hypothetical protein TNCT_284891, partial [Trichonephila clavata]
SNCPGRVGNPAASESQKGFYGSLAPELPNGSNCPPVLVFLFSSVSMVTKRRLPLAPGMQLSAFSPGLLFGHFHKELLWYRILFASLLPLSIEGVGQVKTLAALVGKGGMGCFLFLRPTSVFVGEGGSFVRLRKLIG